MAEGATSGAPNVDIRDRATGCAGSLSATLSSPARIAYIDDHAEWSWPDRSGECLGVGTEVSLSFRHFKTGDMRDQGIKVRPAFYIIDPCDGYRVGCVGTKPVNGFRWHRDETARREDAASCLQVFRCWRNNFGAHFGAIP